MKRASMDTYVFTDLDDTLFQTLRKCGTACSPETAMEHGLHPAAWSREEQPFSYTTPRQRTLLSLLEGTRCIPVTARSEDAFRRVRLPFAHGAVLNYGGTVFLPQGQEDMIWQAHVRDALAPWQQPLETLATALRSWSHDMRLDVRTRVIGHAGMAFYVVIKNTHPEHCVLQRVRQAGEALLHVAADWRVHHNGNNLAFIPTVLNKAHAVRHIIDTVIVPQGRDFLTIGMGDSLIDTDFMNICDYAIVPSGSQIQKVCLHGFPFQR